MFELAPETAVGYLRSHGVVPEVDATARSLGGGVSNRVVAVSWADGCVVAKQPLPNLAVEDDWPADVARVHNEAAAARAYHGILERVGIENARAPAVALEDRDAHVIAIECAPEDVSNWKRDLLDGQVAPDVARTAGAVLGAVHATAADDASLRSAFASKRPFEQLRIEPYHRTVADRHPDVAEAVHEEIERVLSVDRTLVHGDYSPKNVLVEPDGTVWILDFEVAHWGDPAFDVAFMLNHLLIKSVYNHDRGREYADAAFAFWAAYAERIEWSIEPAVVSTLGVLVLARVDGKSPVEYVSEGPIADALRRIGKRTILGEAQTIEDAARIASEERGAL